MLRILAVALVSTSILASPVVCSTWFTGDTESSKLLAGERLDSFREPMYGGGGGFFMGYIQAKFDNLNAELADMDVPQLSEGIYVWGGGGYGTITPRLRIGGMGAGGIRKSGATVSNAAGDTTFIRDFQLSMGYGGVILEYLAIATERFDLSFGAMLGAGGVELQLSQRSGIDSWEEVWENYQTFHGTNNHISSRLTAEFFAYNPYITAKYWLTEWLAIRASGGYFGGTVSQGNWKENGKAELSDSPEVDFSGYTVRVGFHFGYEGAL